MGKKSKLAIGIIVIVGAASVLGMSAAKRGNKAVEVRMEAVQKRDLVASVTASGQVRPQTKVDVASDVSGKITKLSVKEGQIVTQGQFLLQIDPAQAEANVQRAEAALASSKAQLAQSQAQLDQAKLNLQYTSVVAAQSGRVVKLSGAKGTFVTAGQSLMMFVPDEVWIVANYKETQLNDMRPGQPVEIRIDAYPGRKLTGHVDSVQPGSGTAFSLLPAENATGNYVKVVQRVPVKIVLDEVPRDVVLGPGMSAVPKVRVR